MESMGQAIVTIGNLAVSNALSAAWPAANTALYIPFYLPGPILVVKLFSLNGAAVSGNIDMGIYDEKGTRMVSAGSTVQTGTSTIQEFDVTDTIIGPGLFYLAVALDNATGTLFRASLGSTYLKAMGMQQQATAFPLPATATFASVSNANIPCVALTTRTVV